MLNKKVMLIAGVLLLLLIIMNNVIGVSQTYNSDSLRSLTNTQANIATDNSNSANSLIEIKNLRSIWDIIRLAGFFRWWLIGNFVLGMIVVIYKAVELFLDGRYSRNLEQVNLSKATITDLMRIMKNNKNSILSKLYKYVLDLYQTRRTAEGISDDIVDFRQVEQDRFQSFVMKMSFLSDTAGALGLLGTVWGMFITFFGGDLEKHKILSGMGIALVTTIMGLCISIPLNLFTTQVSSYFRKRLDKITDLGGKLRLRLHQLEQTLDNSFPEAADLDVQPNEEPYQISDAVIAAVDRQLKQKELVINLENTTKNNNGNGNYRLIPIAGNNQSMEVTTRLERPFVVQVSDGNGNGIADKTVVFEVIKGDGKLSNGRKQDELLTDASGLAQTQLILGSTAGEHRVRAKVKDGENSDIYFTASGKPAEPTKMIYISGNHQNSPAAKELREPFVVKVTDKFDNPVSGWPINYKVIKGKGHFPEKKNIFFTKTDDNGIAEAYFTLGDEPGFNSVRASAKSIKRAKIEFEALGQD